MQRERRKKRRRNEKRKRNSDHLVLMVRQVPVSSHTLVDLYYHTAVGEKRGSRAGSSDGSNASSSPARVGQRRQHTTSSDGLDSTALVDKG